MRISDWSSDVCSSDLSPSSVQRAVELGLPLFLGILGGTPDHWARYGRAYREAWSQRGHPAGEADIAVAVHGFVGEDNREAKAPYQIGRASCRERVCQYVSISVFAVSFKKKTTT